MKKNNKSEDRLGSDMTPFDYDWTGEEFAYIRKQASFSQLDIALQSNRRSRQAISRYEVKDKIPMWLIDVLRMLISEDFIINARKRFAEGDRL